MKLLDRLLGQRPQFGCELDFATAFALGVKHRAVFNRKFEHFLQTQRLRAKLRVVVLELAALAFFVLDGTKRTAAVLLDDVTFARESKPFGEHRQGAKERHAFDDLIPREIRVLVDDVAEQSVVIVLKDALDVDESGTTRAKQEMIESGERDHLTRSARVRWRWN